MADYSKWTEKMVAVTSLSLDPKNPRIPPSDGGLLDPRALIAELVEHDDVLALMKDIVTHGYAPIESLIGWVDEDDGKTYILEGNRRLAALKLLLSPDSAPDAVVKKVRALSKDMDLDSIRKVRVLFAPTRRAAAPLIMQKHTRQQIERWSPLMQARFYRTLADSGLTAADLAREYGATAGEVAQFLRTDATYQLARRMTLPAAIKAKVDDPRNFPMSTLQRILDTPKARELLGIDFDERGAISGTVDKNEFQKGLTRILSDIVSDKENTRTLNTREDVEAYLGRIKTDLPDRKKKGTFVVGDFEQPDEAKSPTPKPAPKKPATRSGPSPSVIPKGLKCSVKNTRINEVFTELRLLRLDKNPNASAVLFRILLELAIGHHLDKTKKIQPLLAAAQKKGKGNDWYPTLRQMLDAVLKDPSFVFPALARKKLQKFVSDQTSPLSVDGLDSYVHSRFAPPTARELRHYWDTFEDLFAVILEEPSPPPRKGSN